MVALRSPYLLSNARLRETAAGGKPLAEGDVSSGVAQVQAALLDLGYGLTGSAGPGQLMDGAFGTGTAELVKAFQSNNGLAPTGLFDMGTLLAADQALAVKTPVLPSYKGRRGPTTTVPTAQPVRRGIPPIGPNTPRPLPYEDEHYMIGTEDPFIVPDAGAGIWKSKPTSYSATALAAAVESALANQAGLVIGWHANEHLLHYFQNTGLNLKIDFENMIRAVPSARLLFLRAYRLAQAFLGDLPNGIYDFTMRYAQQGYNLQSENRDWFFAIGGYSSWGKGKAQILGSGVSRQYRMDFEYNFSDRYNWDSGKSVDIGPLVIEDKMLGEFHLQGLAKEYMCYGSLRRHFRWTGNHSPADALVLMPGGR